MQGERVLVTGGSGFVGIHCILQLLEAGYRVRTTVRTQARENEVRAMLVEAGQHPNEALEVILADLTRDDGWADAVAGCDYVLHVASPFPLREPKHEDELLIPAREGTIRVLRAARDAAVRRVVLTSSFAAIGYGHPPTERAFIEADWTDVSAPGLATYVKSKTVAERAAWDFIARQGGRLELAVVNPVGIFGPALGSDYSSSIQLLKQIMEGTLPALPNISTNTVDVRDVADLHLRAMTHPNANGERFLAVAGEPLWLKEVAALLRARMGDAAKRAPTRTLPNWIIRLGGRLSAQLRPAAAELGTFKRASNEKARRVLGWTPRSNEEALLAAAKSLLRRSD